MTDKRCFMDSNRPCDLTCKAAFEVDDPVDNVDCYFIWLTHHFGEGLFEVRRLLDSFGGAMPPGFPSSFGGGPTGPGGTPPTPGGPKGPKGFPEN